MVNLFPTQRFSTLCRTILLAALPLCFLLLSCDIPGKKPPVIEKAEIGKQAPDFILTDTHGKSWWLKEQRGKVVFLNFWATWCPPCREEMPSMVTLDKAMTGRPFLMLTVLSNDDPNIAENFVRGIGATFPVLLDPANRIAKAYGLTGVPETFIIDANGILREKYIGPRPWDSPAVMEMMTQYLP